MKLSDRKTSSYLFLFCIKHMNNVSVNALSCNAKLFPFYTLNIVSFPKYYFLPHIRNLFSFSIW